MRNETILTKGQTIVTGYVNLRNVSECVVIVERIGNEIRFRRA